MIHTPYRITGPTQLVGFCIWQSSPISSIGELRCARVPAPLPSSISFFFSQFQFHASLFHYSYTKGTHSDQNQRLLSLSSLHAAGDHQLQQRRGPMGSSMAAGTAHPKWLIVVQYSYSACLLARSWNGMEKKGPASVGCPWSGLRVRSEHQVMREPLYPRYRRYFQFSTSVCTTLLSLTLFSLFIAQPSFIPMLRWPLSRNGHARGLLLVQRSVVLFLIWPAFLLAAFLFASPSLVTPLGASGSRPVKSRVVGSDYLSNYLSRPVKNISCPYQ